MTYLQILKKHKGTLTLSIALGVLVTLLVVSLVSTAETKTDTWTLEADAREVGYLAQNKASFEEFSKHFSDLAREKSGVYAFEVMKVAQFPFGLDLHLLGHVVGDIMYEQEGIEGMGLCTHDFRNACSHTMVIGALIEFGTQAFPDIQEACYNAPGGLGAYTMCFHGLGHGVLSFNGYDFPKTIAMCDALGTLEYNDREAIECFGGAVMEIIGGGGHDEEVWAKKRVEYLTPEDPFRLCRKDFVPQKYRPMCYNYMTPYVFEAYEANMAYPEPAIYEKTFDLCARIPEENGAERYSCYGGLGKEFIGIATGRNFTPGFEPTEEHLATMYGWCLLAKEKDGQRYCIESTLNSLYWGGERPYETSLTYCGLIEDKSQKDACHYQLVRNVSFYMPDPEYRQRFCADVPDDYQTLCSQQLL